MNPFVGAVFSAVWGVAVTIDALRSGAFVQRVLRHAIAVVPVALAVAWCVANQMVEGAGSALQFGWLGDARKGPIFTLILSLGPALVAALAGTPSLLPPKGGDYKEIREEGGEVAQNGAELPQKTPAVSGFSRKLAPPLLAIVSLILMYFVRLNVDTSWVGFRAGQMFLVAVPALIAGAFVARGVSRCIGIAVVAIAFLAGLPTTTIDVYNAQDITNFSPSPIGPWTVTITPDEQAGLEFLRRVTAPTAIVQMDPQARGRSTWSLIPSFAQRRMAAGQPISLLGGTQDDSEYGQKSARVRTMYQTESAGQAADIARSLRIDYIWVDRTERAAYPNGVAKFDADPARFTPVFVNAEVRIFGVR
jgi:hypothetical protein